MRKSAPPAVLLALLAIAFAGCPIYQDDEVGCRHDLDCGSGYVCDQASSSCIREASGPACRRPSDCDVNETCSRDGVCTLGDCHFESTGCVTGYVCSSSSGRWQCEEAGSDTSAGAPGSGGNPSSGGQDASGGAADESAAGAGHGGAR